jgi:hypothetical protein
VGGREERREEGKRGERGEVFRLLVALVRERERGREGEEGGEGEVFRLLVASFVAYLCTCSSAAIAAF